MNTWEEITEDCVRLFAIGEAAAFEQVLHALEAQVLGYLINICRDRELAKELAQDVWLKIWAKIRADQLSEKFATKAKLRAWIFQIARNLLMDNFRKTKRMNVGDVTASSDHLAILEARDEAVTEAETAKLKALMDCLETIDTDKAELLRMYCEGLSVQQIADVLGVGEQIVYQRKNRAIADIKPCVKGKLA